MAKVIAEVCPKCNISPYPRGVCRMPDGTIICYTCANER